MSLIRSASILVFLFSEAVWCFSPQTGSDPHRTEIYQRALNAQSRLTVLSVSLQPGFEDLPALAYFRYGRGAKIVDAFVTNGESGDNEIAPQGPGEVAFQRRSEAAHVADALQGIEYFMNFPDFGSGRDVAGTESFWPKDSLVTSLVVLIETIRPDIILLAPDRHEQGGESPRQRYMRSVVRSAVETAAAAKTASGFVRPRAWKVKRVLVATGDGRLTFPLKDKGTFQTKSYSIIGSDLARMYQSMESLVSTWSQDHLAYVVDYPARSKVTKTPDAGIPGSLPARIKAIGQRVDGVWKAVVANLKKKGSIDRYRSSTLKRLVEAMDSIDIRLGGWNIFANEERKILLHWKEGLEELRNALFGVKVHYRMKDTVLLARQLTTLRIDSVAGLPGDGITEIFFPDVGARWLLNEELQPKIPLNLRTDYRLISPSSVDYGLPASYGGMNKNRHGEMFEFFILHQKKARTESFFKKVSQRIFYAPKLTVEPLTPIVRMTTGEYVVCRITNHSNDGIRDRLGVGDTIATAESRLFRLNTKEGSVVDTLFLSWNDAAPEGTYRVPLQIGGAVLGYFGARKFDAVVDPAKRVGVLAASPSSAVVQSLRRLGVRYRLLGNGLRSQDDARGLDVLVLDERILSLHPGTVDSHFSFGEYMDAGGTVLVFSQDADSWNDDSLLQGITLESTTTLDAAVTVAADSVHPLMNTPNEILESDWDEWLFSKALNRATVQSREMSVPVTLGDAEHTAAVIVHPRGKGKAVYVNLNLGKQLENIHPGAFRFLANLLAY